MNITAAWIGILLGLVSGTLAGSFFHRESFLGGYGSWRRRLVRLAHISFFGLAFLNILYVLTVDRAAATGKDPGSSYVGVSGALFIAGAILMPSVCYLAAWRVGARRLFFLPVGALIAAAGSLLIWEITT